MHLRGLLGTVALVAGLPAAGYGQVIIDNGTVALGINPAGNLIVPFGNADGGLGLTFIPTDGEALAPGCFCEGWGVADLSTGAFGQAGADFGLSNIASSSVTATGTGSFAGSAGNAAIATANVVDGALNLLVTHNFGPSASVNLFSVGVSILNQGADTVGNLVYRRAMDWDVPPTPFSEFVTIQGWPATRLIGSSNDGFADGNPNIPLSTISGSGAVLNGNFTNAGPDDHGAVFDFGFGALAAGGTQTFTMFYGAAASEADALIALGAVGAEVYSLGKPSSDGGLDFGVPNTFIFAFAGVGGTPIGPGGAILPINQFPQVAEAFIGRLRGDASARMADQGFYDMMAGAGILSPEVDRGRRQINFHLGLHAGGGKTPATTNNVAVDYSLRGLSVAVDTRIDTGIAGMESALIGAQIGRSTLNADLGTGFGTLDARSTDLALYGRMSGSSPVFAEGIVHFGRHDYTQVRQGLMDMFTSTPSGRSAGALARVGYSQKLAAPEGAARTLSWYGELSTNRTRISEATENNNGLRISTYSDRQNYGGLGVRFEAARKQGDVVAFARIDAAALVEIGNSGYTATQTTAGGAVLTGTADASGGNALRLRGTLGAIQSDRMTASLEYSGLYGRGATRDHRVTARVKFEF